MSTNASSADDGQFDEQAEKFAAQYRRGGGNRCASGGKGDTMNITRVTAKMFGFVAGGEAGRKRVHRAVYQQATAGGADRS
jgi:hypothetical protein